MRTSNLYIGLLLTITLAGCSAGKMPPFASSQWSLTGNEASSTRHDITIDFGGKDIFPIANAGNGEYDLNFITSDEQFQTYPCKKYIASAINLLPLKIDSMELVLADQFVIFTPSVINVWRPDYVRRSDGVMLVVDANPQESDIQPHDEIWRNFIFDNKRHRILVIDRLVKDGKHLGIIYIMQSKDKHVPFCGTFEYDIFAKRNTQPVGEFMRGLFNITIDAANSHAPPHPDDE